MNNLFLLNIQNMHHLQQEEYCFLSFFLKYKSSFLPIYVPVGLFGLAKKTILVFLVTLESISLIDIVKFFSLA